ncbi:ClC family H(+)/Cl(-) exchange transporter [Fumia xinanensis]|uniref:ClC family H(+)/Cl(-) exchange transporter n=1 Tax=Fumia xinanensis TaxID=2763659 RepID=A0A926I6R3_9FIRM|nr:ClC family H(+)/Cl(-) exchange transporter [Fumia xinanensis]MBC8559126.1 ClC family H(+)/Cl(-) exchange transporter [Fumia xinanensis]
MAQNHSISKTLERFRSFRYTLVLEGVAVGALSGFVIVLFRLILEHADMLLKGALEYGKENAWFIPVWLCILAAFSYLVYRLVKWEPMISGSGIPQVEGEMEGKLSQNWWKVLVAKCAGGILSIGSGLSLGREGPSIQLGAMAAKGFSRLTKRIKTEERLLMTCGASAGLAAAFNAPFAGVLFSLEEVHKNFSPEVLLSTMASSITADFIARNVFGLAPVFSFHVPQMMPLSQYGHVIFLGILLGLLGVVYNLFIGASQKLYAKIKWEPLRLLIPFVCAGALGFTLPEVLGGGHPLALKIAEGKFALSMLCLIFAVKFLFSMVSFGSGAPGGIFLPLLVMGAMIGSVYYGGVGAVNLVPDGLLSNFLILGMAGYFSAIVRAPITGIILISEMTGSFNHLLTLTIVSLFAYLVPDLLKCRPIYDSLLRRLLEKQKPGAQPEPTGEKVLIDCVISHGSAAENRTVADVVWPEHCLVVSVMRGEEELVPKGNTALRAGDRIILLCDENFASETHLTLEHQCRMVRLEQEGR